ncbi:MAG TPA: PHP domain-containing protein [Agriterribacter sp.]|nr:PHP domain-containing protein [Agriterribacter sp.]
MDNLQIADCFSLLSKLMDIHGENSFKSKSYAAAAYTVEKTPLDILSVPDEQLFQIKGIGSSIGKQIIELRQTGRLNLLEDYLQKTPDGVLEMLQIKGLGPRKIAVIWKEMEIENIGELLYACNENRLLLYKGFGEKTQHNVRSAIEFYLNSKGSYLYAEIESSALLLHQDLLQKFPHHAFEFTGSFARQMEIIDELEWVTTVDTSTLESVLGSDEFMMCEKSDLNIRFATHTNLQLTFYKATERNFGTILFQTSCSAPFLQEWNQQFPSAADFSSEKELFSAAGIPFIPSCRRENQSSILASRGANALPLIQPADVRGVIHSHSNWSDGRQSIEEMAIAAIEKGFEYLVISDHSKSAFYAGGLNEERIKEQHRQIDALNEKLRPFKIFKSIESDILNDGKLDYSDQMLNTFDLVIASIHSNLKMTEEKAMQRLLTAIQNPFTTILGHMTGRLLLSRAGYPVDHHTIIDACAAHDVTIELNAHPRRLDIDWRWIEYALEKQVLISINPDAHHTSGFNDIRYGVLVAQKAGVVRENNLGCYSLTEFENFLQKRKEKKRR